MEEFEQKVAEPYYEGIIQHEDLEVFRYIKECPADFAEQFWGGAVIKLEDQIIDKKGSVQQKVEVALFGVTFNLDFETSYAGNFFSSKIKVSVKEVTMDPGDKDEWHIKPTRNQLKVIFEKFESLFSLLEQQKYDYLVKNSVSINEIERALLITTSLDEDSTSASKYANNLILFNGATLGQKHIGLFIKNVTIGQYELPMVVAEDSKTYILGPEAKFAILKSLNVSKFLSNLNKAEDKVATFIHLQVIEDSDYQEYYYVTEEGIQVRSFVKSIEETIFNQREIDRILNTVLWNSVEIDKFIPAELLNHTMLDIPQDDDSPTFTQRIPVFESGNHYEDYVYRIRVGNKAHDIKFAFDYLGSITGFSLWYDFERDSTFLKKAPSWKVNERRISLRLTNSIGKNKEYVILGKDSDCVLSIEASYNPILAHKIRTVSRLSMPAS